MTSNSSTNINRIDTNWFKSYSDSSDELGLVLRTHMEVEAQVDRILTALVVFPDQLEKMHLDYYGKVRLAVVLGVDPEIRATLKQFGTLRNRFAHAPNQLISKGDAKNLYKLLPDWLKRFVHNVHLDTNQELYPDGAYLKFNDLPAAQQYWQIFLCVIETLRKHEEKALNNDVTYVD